MTFTITALDEDRLDETAALWHEGWHDAHAAIVPPELTRLRTLESMRARLAARIADTWTALASDGPDRAAVAGFFTLEGNELYQFYVARSARGSGVAGALMREAETRLCNGGHRRAWLACSIGNARAARFYEKAGWVNAGAEEVALETAQGAFPLEVWRFEKALT